MYHRTATSFKIPQALQNLPNKEARQDAPITDRITSKNSNFLDGLPDPQEDLINPEINT